MGGKPAARQGDMTRRERSSEVSLFDTKLIRNFMFKN